MQSISLFLYFLFQWILWLQLLNLLLCFITNFRWWRWWWLLHWLIIYTPPYLNTLRLLLPLKFMSQLLAVASWETDTTNGIMILTIVQFRLILGLSEILIHNKGIGITTINCCFKFLLAQGCTVTSLKRTETRDLLLLMLCCCSCCSCWFLCSCQ